MKRLICLLVLGILGQGVYANNAGEKGAAFLKLGQGARANGMAGAYSAIADDSSACYWNPAGLVQLEQNEALFMYHRPMTEVDGLAYSNISMVLPSVNEAYGVSLVYLGYGQTKGYDNTGKSASDWSASDMVISGSYAKRINQKLSVGASLKAIQLRIDDKGAQAICLDAGLLCKDYYPNLNLAAVLTNLGTKPKFEKLRLGGAYKKNLKFPTFISFDTNLSPFYVALGIESQISPIFVGRAGYASGPADEGSGLTAGFGITQQSLSLDYAIRPYGELGLSHYLSLSSRF
ncbi:PorV/PorQ family protein [Candidatus Desantisbacteria bacterium]|nr:PorV/PorQ family protein [Candidatus Desantisbacteria bacterium]